MSGGAGGGRGGPIGGRGGPSPDRFHRELGRTESLGEYSARIDVYICISTVSI
jgi:hypothetical protein